MRMPATRELRSEMRCKAGGSVSVSPCVQGSAECCQIRRRADLMIWSKPPKRISAPKGSFTDPDSHLMQSGGSYLQGYNCQLAVDSGHQEIVAVGVSNQPPDVKHLESMLQRITATAGALPEVMTMDAGYWSEDNAKCCSDQGIDAYIATGRLPLGQPLPPKRGPLPRDADARSRMARKLRSKKGSAIYAQRKAIVEPVNGQIKEARGLRRFLLRGLGKIDGEWHLSAATHNLLKFFRYRRSQQQGLVGATG